MKGYTGVGTAISERMDYSSRRKLRRAGRESYLEARKNRVKLKRGITRGQSRGGNGNSTPENVGRSETQTGTVIVD